MQSSTLTIRRKFRASKRNFGRQNNTALGPRGQAETSAKIEELRSNKTTGKLSYDQQPEFRSLRVITKLPNSEQSYKGKVKTHNYINRQTVKTVMTLTWYRHFLKKWWVESDFKAPNLPLSLRFKGSGCHYNSI